MSFCLATQVSFEPVFFKSCLPMDCHRSTPATLSAAACKRLSWLCSRISTMLVSIACLEEHVAAPGLFLKKSYLHRLKPRVISICGRSSGGFIATWNRLNGWVPIVEKCYVTRQNKSYARDDHVRFPLLAALMNHTFLTSCAAFTP